MYDYTVRHYTSEQINTLTILSRQVMAQYELKLKYNKLQSTQSELIAAKNAAEKAVLSKSVFLANMSHEIRTPFNAILGTAAILAESALSQDQLENVKIIQTSSEHLLTICNDILDLSKHEHGKMELESRPINLIDCIESAIELSFKQEKSNTVDCIYYIDIDVPQYIMGDSTRVRQILANLISNATKFTAHGTIQIYVSVNSMNELDNTLELKFSCIDSGIGIEQHNIDRLFNAFDQVHSDLHRYGGTGLGLAISSRLVELMNGKFTVTSEVGKGSTFSFTMLTSASSGGSTVSNTRSIGTSNNMINDNTTISSPAHNTVQLPPRHILIYDKNPLVTHSIAHYLSQYNMMCVECNTIEEAHSAMQQAENIHDNDIQPPNSSVSSSTATQPFDCLLVMHDMSHGHDGLKLASELSRYRSASLNNTPVQPNNTNTLNNMHINSMNTNTNTQLPLFMSEPSPLVHNRAVSENSCVPHQPWLNSRYVASPATSLSSLRAFDTITTTHRLPITPQLRVKPRTSAFNDKLVSHQQQSHSMNNAQTISPQSVRMPVIYLLTESIDKISLSTTTNEPNNITTTTIHNTEQYIKYMPYTLRKPIRMSKLLTLIDESISNPTRRQRTLQSIPNNTDSVLVKDLADKYPCRILLVDDNTINIKIALKLFVMMGYKSIDCCYDGSEACELVIQQRNTYDIIFMDLTMPKLSGCDASRMIIEFYNNDPEMITCKLPIIIAMSAAVMNEDRVACVTAGLNDFVSKPISIQGLQNTIKKWVRPNLSPSPAQSQRRIAR